MAYQELIKSFARIRDYMREFYVYGFKSRDEYTKKSARSYDDERRRLESWLGGYMRFRQTADGKNVFLSIDSRLARRNPLYAAWKTKSFTDGDITLHFLLFDLLDTPETALTLRELTAGIDAALASFSRPRTFDESTVRKKLKEYAAEGLILAEKRGKAVYYRRAADRPSAPANVLDFFSEAAPCGVVGSFLLDKEAAHESPFVFKHHYITGAMDSEILCALFSAIGERRFVSAETLARRSGRLRKTRLVPLQIRASAQSGRQYLMAYVPRYRRIGSLRIDNIVSVRAEEVCGEFDAHRRALDRMAPHLWGVSTQGLSHQRLEHVEFTVRYEPHESHIPQRLEREKRCGTVERLGAGETRFSADVYDAAELVPWIRTFLCRITAFSCSDKALERQFLADIRAMYALYGLAEGGEDA